MSKHRFTKLTPFVEAIFDRDFLPRSASLRSQILLSNQSNMGKAVGYGKKPSDMANLTAIAIKAK